VARACRPWLALTLGSRRVAFHGAGESPRPWRCSRLTSTKVPSGKDLAVNSGADLSYFAGAASVRRPKLGIDGRAGFTPRRAVLPDRGLLFTLRGLIFARLCPSYCA